MTVTDQDSIVSEIHIAADPSTIFRALVDPVLVPRWWGQKGVYRCTQYQADLRVGGGWRATGVGANDSPFEAKGEFLEIDSPRLLVYSWVATWTGDVKTTVRWELSATERGTQVILRHSGLSAHSELAQSYRGWPRMLQWLQAFVEKGETVDIR